MCYPFGSLSWGLVLIINVVNWPSEAVFLAVRERQIVSAIAGCKFHAYSDQLRRANREATPERILYQKGQTIVALDDFDPKLRYMLFLRDDGFCHEEALIFCKEGSDKVNKQDEIKKTSALQLTEGRHTGLAKCMEHPCVPVPRISLSYARSMIGGALAYRPSASRGLLVGVGAGMVPLWVQEARHSLALDAVDISDDVLDAAPCFGLRNDSNVRLWLQDGRKYMRGALDTYDIVLLDVFTPKDKMPPCLSTLEFFSEVKSAMRNGGVVAINTWRNEYKSVLATVLASFRSVRLGTAPGESNHILLASDSDISHPVSSSVVKDLGDAVGTWYLEAMFGEVKGDSAVEPRKDNQWCEGHDP